MSANSPDCYTRSGSYLVSDDRLSLAGGLIVRPRVLIDSATGSRHGLHPLAGRGVLCLRDGVSAAVWLDQLDQIGLDRPAQREIIGFLCRIGALEIRRSWTGRLALVLRNAWQVFTGSLPPVRGRRYPLNLVGITVATTAAVWPVVLAIMVSSTLAYGAGLSLGLASSAALVTAVGLWLSTVCHEYAHTWWLVRFKTPATVLQTGLNLGIIHQPIPPTRDVWCAVSGPVAGGVGGWLVVQAAATWLRRPELAAGAWLLVLFHAASLLPAYGDGRAVLARAGKRVAV